MGRSSLKWRLLPLARAGFALVGQRWVDFYGWMLDRQERNNSIAKIKSANRGVSGGDRGLYDLSRCAYHLDYMRRHGLRPHNRVLDFGCGFGRSAIPLLRFLEPGRYTGAEISAERIRMAHEWVKEEGLQSSKPNFIVTKDLDLGYMPDGDVDFFWAQAVVSHMPAKDIARLLLALHRVLAPSGVALFDYVEAQDGYERHSVKDFFYTREQMDEMLLRANWTYDRLHDWNDDLAPENRDSRAVMIRLTK